MEFLPAPATYMLHDSASGHAGRMPLLRTRRYSVGARAYDVLSAERPVYRAGRLLGVQRCGLRTGDRVVDLACGTGLNTPLLLERVGASGTVIGIDASADMLAVARDKADRFGWQGAQFCEGDAGRLAEVLPDVIDVDAVIVSYALSIIDDWRAAFEQALALVRPGGRIVVVDMSYPTGRWRVFAPLVAFAFAMGGVDASRAPWRLVEQTCVEVQHDVVRGGHIHVVSGVKPIVTGVKPDAHVPGAGGPPPAP